MLNRYKKYLQGKGYDHTYARNIAHFLNYCNTNAIDLSTLTFEQLNDFLLTLQAKKFSKGYINNKLKAIRSLYQYLTEIENYNPSLLQTVKKLKLLKEDKKIKTYITPEELDIIIGAGMTYIRIQPIKLKSLLYFLIYTGLRRDELLNLKRTDIDLVNCQATVRIPTKNKVERIIFYPQRIRDMVHQYFVLEPETLNAFNMNRNKLQFLIKKLNEHIPSSMNKKITTHTFRHSFANLLASNEISMRVAQKLLGHKSMQSTMIYYDPDIKIVEKIYKKNII